MANHTAAFRSTLAHVLTRRSLVAATSGLVIVPARASSAMAQGTPPDASPAATPGATPAVADLDALLASGVERGLPGIALAVARGGESVFSGAAGVANVEEQTPLKETDRFRIYSIAKTFTAIVVLQLVDEGVLTLDDTVAQWLDDPAVARIPNMDTATVRQLLNHTSGIYDYADDTDSPFWEDAFLGPNADWTKVWTIEELLAYADADNHAAYFAPGEAYHYSNTDYLLLGMIVEQATGGSFGNELQARILDPLAMDNTFLAEGGDMPEGIVDGYQVIGDQALSVTGSNLSWVWTAGGMVSTTADLMRFAPAVYSGDMLSPESFAEMFTFGPGKRPGLEEGMGIYRIGTPNGQLVGMDGVGPGFIASMMRLEEGDITVVTLVNTAPDDGTTDAIRDEAIAWTLAHPDA
jgi:D-alanyl-D-alanine carboxypeptidase